MSDEQLADLIRVELRAAGDPGRAPGMQAYMKSAMPYHGVRLPEVRRITRSAAQLHPPASVADLAAASAALWRGASFREERYAATALTGLPMAVGKLELLPLHEEMIVTGAWWDHVDEVAHRIGDLLRAHPEVMTPIIRSWSVGADRWLRRTSVICQLDSKTGTDLELLADAILANASDPDFFLRKGIGWALRQYARTDPGWVRAFLAAHHEALSPLSRREAAKHLG